MLAPLSEQQNRNNSQSEIKWPHPPSQANHPDHPDHVSGNPGNSDLFEILNQDLVLSLDESHHQEPQLSLFKDEVPATSS